MKTFLKLFIAVAAFSCVTANAQFTTEQKAAAIKVVTDAVAAAIISGDVEKVKEAVSAQCAAFPELAGDIVAAGLSVPGVTEAIQKAIVSAAAFTVPDEKATIIAAINSVSGLDGTLRAALILIVNAAVDESRSNGKGNASGPPTSGPPTGVSPP